MNVLAETVLDEINAKLVQLDTETALAIANSLFLAAIRRMALELVEDRNDAAVRRAALTVLLEAQRIQSQLLRNFPLMPEVLAVPPMSTPN